MGRKQGTNPKGRARNKRPYPKSSQHMTAPRCPQCGEPIGVWLDCKCPKEVITMYDCAHCQKPIQDKAWRAYVPEKGDEIEHVHHACEAGYEAERDQRAGQKALAPPVRVPRKTAQPTPV